MMELNSVDELISELRQGRMIVLIDDDADSGNEGVVMVAAEHCEASHVTFMARRARGLICLTLLEERCQQLDLPPMVDDAQGEKSNFTLSIEAAVGIDTASIDYGQSTHFRAHVALMTANVPAFENVTNLGVLPPTGAFVVALPTKIAGGSGGPLRIVARLPAGDSSDPDR